MATIILMTKLLHDFYFAIIKFIAMLARRAWW